MAGRSVGRGAPASSPLPVPKPGGSPTVSAEGAAVLRRGDPAVTRNGTLTQGTASVSADGIPLAHEGHVVTDGALLQQGAATVEVAEGHAADGEGQGYVRFHLHVDADRDGRVDDTWEHNGTWTAGPSGHGAVVLVNCDDETDARRIPGDAVAGEVGHSVSPDHDKAPRSLTAPDLDDISPLVLRRDPATRDESHAGWTMKLKVSRHFKFRVFDRNAPGATELIGPNAGPEHIWTDLGQDEIELAMEGLQYPGPFPWDRRDPDPDASDFSGRVVLTLELFAPNGSLDHTEEAVVRVTPWIAFNHFDPTVEVFVADLDDFELIPALRTIVPEAGVPLAVVQNSGAVWAQDGMEPGFSSLPGADASIGCNLAGADRNEAIYYLAECIHGPEVGYAPGNPRAAGRTTFATFGNLETTPPFRHRQRDTVYPFGRLVHGVRGSTGHPQGEVSERVRFYAAQGVQAPIAIETGWLAVAHVDEILCFLPMRDADLGFRVLLASPRLAFELLEEASASRLGHLGLMAHTPGVGFDVDFGVDTLFQSVDALLADDELRQTAEFVEGKMAQTRATLAHEIGLQDDDFIPLPVIFQPSHGSQLGAKTSDVVNGLVITRGGTTWDDLRGVTYVAPDPMADGGGVFGTMPMTTVFNDYVKTALERGGDSAVSVRFAPATFSYHLWDGEVHCGTNSIRRPPTDRHWWDHFP
ncbi:MAG: protein-arginine deiminase family protein [Myxococcota bacterium]